MPASIMRARKCEGLHATLDRFNQAWSSGLAFHPLAGATLSRTQHLNRTTCMNLITLHRWEPLPEYLVAEFHQRGKGWCPLLADGLEDAVQEAAGLAGLDAELRDAQGEEWDILIPEETLAHELPDGEVGDFWWQWRIRDRWWQQVEAEYQAHRVARRGTAFATTQRKPASAKEKPPVGTEGLFYLVRYPQGWRYLPVRVELFPVEDFDHADFWEEVLAQVMAEKWHPEVARKFPTVEQLRDELLPLAYAFPRGRVVSLGRTFAVYHGDNLAAFMQSDRKAIESGFDIQGNVQWEFDEHEQSVAHHRDRLRELLGLKETWPAVSLS